MKRVIFHIDVNSAFLSWEALYRLHHLGGSVDLREQVAAVGGDMAMRHGIIFADFHGYSSVVIRICQNVHQGSETNLRSSLLWKYSNNCCRVIPSIVS